MQSVSRHFLSPNEIDISEEFAITKSPSFKAAARACREVFSAINSAYPIISYDVLSVDPQVAYKRRNDAAKARRMANKALHAAAIDPLNKIEKQSLHKTIQTLDEVFLKLADLPIALDKPSIPQSQKTFKISTVLKGTLLALSILITAAAITSVFIGFLPVSVPISVILGISAISLITGGFAAYSLNKDR